MTSNQERAAEVVGEAYQQAMESSVPSAWRGTIVQALVDAGLLAPDHPEPRMILSDGSPMWIGNLETGIGVEDGLVYVDGALITPEQAKEEAAMILAAAAHAERNQK